MKAMITIILCLFALQSYFHGLHCNRFKEKKAYRVERNLSYGVVVICFIILIAINYKEFCAIWKESYHGFNLG